jgi:predicted MPP superfamily phosphohydrolase
MRALWLTDIHLNFVEPQRLIAFRDELRAARPDALLIGGDIAEGKDLIDYLTGLAQSVACPLYFVLGNHDFYFRSIWEIRAQVEQLCAREPRLVYLTHAAEPIALTPTVALIGHDGWADGLAGDYEASDVMLNDYWLIAELAHLEKHERWEKLQQLAQAAADHLRKQLELALANYPRVILLTHVPPLRAACWHQGQVSDDEWAPHFASPTIGNAVLDVMRAHPERELLILCGHTHGRGECRPLPNVEILTGGAIYGEPEIQRVLELE